MMRMLKAKPILYVLTSLGSILAIGGCSSDANATDNSAKLPPPANVVGGTGGPQEAAAAAHEKRTGLHYQNAQHEGAGGGDVGDGK